MATSGLPPIGELSSLNTESRARVLDLLFEPSVPLHTLSVELLGTQTFSSYQDLVASVGVQLSALAESSSTSDSQWLDSILGAHPRLGAKKVDSEQSRAEQAQLQGGAEEAAKLKALNEAYEQAFPGLRYVTFVNGRSRPVIMEDMQARVTRADPKQERADAIQAMCDIAIDRSTKLS